jgi:hypothetical protein
MSERIPQEREAQEMIERAAIYARVCAEEEHNLAEQLEACRDYAQQRDLQVVAEFTDAGHGASGAASAPPQLNHALELARMGGFDVLVVRDAYRLSRSLANLLKIEDELYGHSVQIDYVLHGDHDTSTQGLMKDYFRYLKGTAQTRHTEKPQYLLRGRVTCAQCGHRMRGHVLCRKGRWGRKRYSYYRCDPRRGPKHARNCEMPSFRAGRVDTVVWNWLAQRLQQSFPEMEENLKMLDDDFETRRQIVDMLDVQVTLALEDGEKVLYIQSILEETASKVFQVR